MGDPISPAMTIGALAWMEKEWMREVTNEYKKFFRAKRYMDDIIMILVENEKWDHTSFLAAFEESKCYEKPLKLEDGGAGTFLETSFEVQQNRIRYWLKNENKNGQKKVWRYQHYQSYATYGQKRATLMACLRKCQKMASDKDAMRTSAWDKIAEFIDLSYPTSILRKACNYLGATSHERTWFDIRDAL